MSIVGDLEKVFVSAPKTLLSSRELERSTQERMFFAFAGFIGVITALYTVVYASRGRTDLAVETGGAFLFVLGCVGAARRLSNVAVPMHALSTLVFAWVAYATLRQGSGLPAAAWWLSIIPFILAGAGLYHLAIGSVLAFVGVVTYLYVAPSFFAGIPQDPVVEPWRRYAAIVGSEILALGLILVAMRSRAQVAEALETARVAASEAASLKARFLANMSHEIRTPLTGIIGAAEIMDSEKLSDAQRVQLVQMQRQSARTLLALVNDVLDFAKLESGKIQLEHRPVFLRGVVFEANELFSMQAFAKGIELSSSCNPDVPQSFHGDSLRLRQIVNNLASNAVKFTSKGGVHMHLSLDPIEEGRVPSMDGKRWVRIEVVDSGPGIPESRMQTLFSAFVQADPSVTRRFGGTGLGLSIANELSRLMGGRIEVRSVVGRGSSFALVVPLTVESQEESRTTPSRRSDVVLAVGNRGLERHLKSLLHELDVLPVTVERLPTPDELDACRLLFIDAPLLQVPSAREWLAVHATAGRRVVILTPLGADTVVGLPESAELLFKPVRKKSLEALLQSRGEHGFVISSPPPVRPFEDLHVLVADDNPVNQVVVQAMLAELGATCAVASNGLEALEYALAEPFDAVLMDLHMPQMDGIVATRALRKTEAEQRLARTAVLATTATLEGEDSAACLAAGMDGFLTKPFGLAQLRRALETLVGNPSDRHATVAPGPSRPGRRSVLR